MSKLNYLNPYHWIIQARHQLYDKGVISCADSQMTPVISVGNINTGGSGKTPFIRFLVEEIQKHYPQLKIVIISKSYKASLNKPSEVLSTDIHKSDIFGDEPCLLKSLLSVDVWSGPIKAETLNQALKNKKYDLAIIDDGFSHLKIQRDLDIVLFDVSREPKHYRLIPLGFMREAWSALTRSHLVILTKVENQSLKKIQLYKNKISSYQENILQASYSTELQLESKDLFLFTGLGNPQALVQSLESDGYNIIEQILYPDHFNFPFHIQEEIWQKIQTLNEKTQAVTTAKDFIKITHPHLKKRIKVIELKVSMEATSIMNQINEILHAKHR